MWRTNGLMSWDDWLLMRATTCGSTKIDREATVYGELVCIKRSGNTCTVLVQQSGLG